MEKLSVGTLLDNDNKFGWKASLEEYYRLLRCEASRPVQPSPTSFSESNYIFQIPLRLFILSSIHKI